MQDRRVIGLRWSDINFNDNYIEINHSITYFPRHDKNYKCEFRISLPKTDSGIRQIPMLDKVREVLLQEKEYQEKTGIRCITEIDGMKGFIFFNRYGFVHKPSSLNKEIHRIVINYNAAEEVRASREGRRPRLVPDFSCHITRHTFCSRLCENETNVKVIQQVMGHKDIRTTLDIYAEVFEAKKQEVFKELNSQKVL